MVVWTGIALATQARWLRALLGLIAAQYEVTVLPARILPQDLLNHGLTGQDPRLQIRHTISTAELAILQGFLSLKLPDVTHRWPEVQGAMREGTVQAVLHTVAPCIGLMNTRACLVVAQVVLALRVPSCSVQVGAFVAVGTQAGGLIVLGAVYIRAVVEGAISPSERSAPPLI